MSHGNVVGSEVVARPHAPSHHPGLGRRLTRGLAAIALAGAIVSSPGASAEVRAYVASHGAGTVTVIAHSAIFPERVDRTQTEAIDFGLLIGFSRVQPCLFGRIQIGLCRIIHEAVDRRIQRLSRCQRIAV